MALIEDTITIDPEAKKAWFRYPMIKDLALLQDNRAQVIAIETSIQKSLIKRGQLEMYNDVV